MAIFPFLKWSLSFLHFGYRYTICPYSVRLTRWAARLVHRQVSSLLLMLPVMVEDGVAVSEFMLSLTSQNLWRENVHSMSPVKLTRLCSHMRSFLFFVLDAEGYSTSLMDVLSEVRRAVRSDGAHGCELILQNHFLVMVKQPVHGG